MELYICIFFILALLVQLFKESRIPLIALIINVLFVACLIALRGPDVDNDYHNYVMDFYGRGNISEVSFEWITASIRFLNGKPIWMFLIYAILGMILKIVVLYRYSPLFFLSLLLYYSTSFVLQDMNAIRVGVATGFIYYGLRYWSENNRWITFCCILLSIFFHYSCIIFIPMIWLINNDQREFKWYILLIPLSYVFYSVVDVISLLSYINLPYIAMKLKDYQSVEVVFSPFAFIYLLRIFIVIIFFLYANTLTIKYSLFPSLFKFYILSIVILISLGSLPVVASRFSEIFLFSELLLLPMLINEFKEKWIGSLIGIGYALIYFILYYFIAQYIHSYTMISWDQL